MYLFEMVVKYWSIGDVDAENNGMDVINASIRKSIENRLSIGKRNFIIFPYGDIGMRVKNILNMAYGVEEKAIVDNNLCKYNKKIHSSIFFEEIRVY